MNLFVLVSSSKSHASFLLFSEREKLFLDDDDFNDFGEEVDFFSARRKKGARRDDDDDALVRAKELALHIAFCLVIILGVVIVVVIIPLLSYSVLFSLLFKGIWSEKKWIKSLLFGAKEKEKKLHFSHTETLLLLLSAFVRVEQTRKPIV